jgi:hypothetical protein
VFEIQGKIGDKAYKLGFRRTGDNKDDYIVSGDAIPIEKFLKEVKVDHGKLGPIPADFSLEEGYSSDDLPAYALACQFVFDEVTKEKNDWEPLDPNAIY